VSPVLPPVRKEFGSPVPRFRKEPGLRRLISLLHADNVSPRGGKSIRQGPNIGKWLIDNGIPTR
jgi:hypothetical protein